MNINSVSFGCNYCKQAQGYRSLATGVSMEEAKEPVDAEVDKKQAENKDKFSPHEPAAREVRDEMRQQYQAKYLKKNN